MKNILSLLFATTLVSLQLCCAEPVIIGIDGDSPEIREYIQDAWTDIDLPDYRIILIDDIDAVCSASFSVDGCTNSSGLIMVESGLSEERKLVIILHEMGHLIKGTGGHLECNGMTDTMCKSGSLEGELPTERDIAFVRAK